MFYFANFRFQFPNYHNLAIHFHIHFQCICYYFHCLINLHYWNYINFVINCLSVRAIGLCSSLCFCCCQCLDCCFCSFPCFHWHCKRSCRYFRWYCNHYSRLFCNHCRYCYSRWCRKHYLYCCFRSFHRYLHWCYSHPHSDCIHRSGSDTPRHYNFHNCSHHRCNYFQFDSPPIVKMCYDGHYRYCFAHEHFHNPFHQCWKGIPFHRCWKIIAFDDTFPLRHINSHYHFHYHFRCCYWWFLSDSFFYTFFII